MKRIVIKERIEAHNNTIVHEVDGQMFIDSMKYPRVFEALGKECGFSVIVLDAPTERDVLFGEKASGFKYAGIEFNCYAMMVKI